MASNYPLPRGPGPPPGMIKPAYLFHITLWPSYTDNIGKKCYLDQDKNQNFESYIEHYFQNCKSILEKNLGVSCKYSTGSEIYCKVSSLGQLETFLELYQSNYMLIRIELTTLFRTVQLPGHIGLASDQFAVDIRLDEEVITKGRDFFQRQSSMSVPKVPPGFNRIPPGPINIGDQKQQSHLNQEASKVPETLHLPSDTGISSITDDAKEVTHSNETGIETFCKQDEATWKSEDKENDNQSFMQPVNQEQTSVKPTYAQALAKPTDGSKGDYQQSLSNQQYSRYKDNTGGDKRIFNHAIAGVKSNKPLEGKPGEPWITEKETTLMLYIPKRLERAMKVTVSSNHSPLDNMDLVYDEKLGVWMSGKVKVPVDKPRYKYVATFPAHVAKQFISFGLKQTDKLEEVEDRILKETEISRDIFHPPGEDKVGEKNPYYWDVLHGLQFYTMKLGQDVNKNTFAKRIDEWIALGHAQEIGFSHNHIIGEFISWFSGVLDKCRTNLETLFLTICFCQVTRRIRVSNYNYLKRHTYFTKDIAMKCLRSMQDGHHSFIRDYFSNLISMYCEFFIRKAYNADLCVFSMSHFFPLLKIQEIETLKVNCKRTTLDSGIVRQAVLRLVNLLNIEDGAESLILTLFGKIDETNFLFNLGKTIESMYSDNLRRGGDLIQMIQNVMRNRIMIDLKKDTTPKNLGHFIKMIMHFDRYENDSTVTDLAVMRLKTMLQQNGNKWDGESADFLLQMVLSPIIPKQGAPISELLTLISKSNDEYITTIMFKLMENETIVNCLSSEDCILDLCTSILEGATNSPLLLNDKMQQSYLLLNQIVSTLAVKDHVELNCKLKELVREWFLQQDLVTAVKNVYLFPEDMDLSIVVHHVGLHIIHAIQQNSEFDLGTLLWTDIENFEMHRRILVLKIILDSIGQTEEFKHCSTKQFSTMVHILNNCEFWKYIFCAEECQSDEIVNHPTSKQIKSIIQTLGILVVSNDMSYTMNSAFKEIAQKQEGNVEDLFSYACDWDEGQLAFCIERITKEISLIKQQLDEIVIIIVFLTELNPADTRSNINIWDLDQQRHNQKEMFDFLHSSDIPLRCLLDEQQYLGNFKHFYAKMKEIHSVCQLETFKASVQTELLYFKQSTESSNADDNLSESMMLLFEEETNINLNVTTEEIIHFICDKCIPVYRNKVEHTFYDEKMAVTVDNVASFLKSSKNNEEEIKNIEKWFQSSIPQPIKRALEYVSNLSELHEKTVSFLSLASALFHLKDDTSEWAVALNAVLLTTTKAKSERLTLFDLQKTVFRAQNMFQQFDAEEWLVIQELSHSKNLLSFLVEIAEDDLRNLIDAVEEHSEQYVQASTVSALIQLKRYLYPVLSEDITSSDILANHLRKCKTKEIKSVPVQINMCTSNIHALKGLYKSVSNRGELTKEIASNILLNGRVLLVINPYKQHLCISCPKKEAKEEVYNVTELKDLRSRCLLISNAEKSGKEFDDKAVIQNMKSLIQMTDCFFEIWDLLRELHHFGHFRYKSYNWQSCKRAEEKLKELLELQTTLKVHKEEWETILNRVRKKHYYMNFIHSDQIWILQEFLENGVLDGNVKSILNYLLPGVNLQTDFNWSPIAHVNDTDDNFQAKLENLGKALQIIMERMKCSTYMAFQNKENFVKLIENEDACVQKGKMFLAHNDSKNAQFVPCLLSLYANTTMKFPKPHELLICSAQTKWEEVNLLISRCTLYSGDGSDYNLHAIVGAEQLDFEVQFKLVSKLKEIHKHKEKEFLLAILCRSSILHPLVVEFSSFVHHIPGISEEALRICLHDACPSVKMITSDLPGLGKTEYIFKQALSKKRANKCIHISGSVDKQNLTELFISSDITANKGIHLDVGVVDNPEVLDSFLFELIVLKCAVFGTKIVHFPAQDIYIEVANTLRHELRDNMYIMSCFERIHLIWADFDDFVVSSNINSQMQIVCQYLHAQETGTLSSRDICFSGDRKEDPLSPDRCRVLLKNCLASTADISFAVAHIFLQVLSYQLVKLSNSPYFKVRNLHSMLKEKEKVYQVRNYLVEEIKQSSLEFACRSINTCKSSQNLSIVGKENMNKHTQAMLKRVEGMIRWVDSNHFLVAFHGENAQTMTPLYRKVSHVPAHAKELFSTQMGKKLDDYNAKSQDELKLILQNIIGKKVPGKVNVNFAHMLNHYAVTPDNLLKMVLILMRLRSNIPVVLMGETGCGKTTLIRYLALTAGVQLEVLPLHAGVRKHEIVEKVRNFNERAKSNPRAEFWLFLDEINTCNHLGMLNKILCHRSLYMTALSPNLKCLAACNPYRRREQSDVFTAGLKGKSYSDQFTQLVYRVHPLPESLIDYVWDYGTLSEEDEQKYILRMTSMVHPDILLSQMGKKLTKLLGDAQKYIRETLKNEWCVSLRDVHRCCYLISWFYKMLKEKSKFAKPTKKSLSDKDYIERAVFLSLAHCYEVRLQDSFDRVNFWKKVGKTLYEDKTKLKMHEPIMKMIREEQMDILNRMKIGEGIAKNTALRENIFIIFVCILNRIPVFLVGKPGCSKSLSMQLLKSNLRGLDSPDPYFQTLPQIYVVSYQGSESSTAEGIIKIFDKAKKYKQQQKANENILPVILLDEIGLAEVSKYNPLKVLHSLLEPSTGLFPEVAVVGISNWALDAAKMNRAIHLSRPDLDKGELLDTGISISTVYSGKGFTSEKKEMITVKRQILQSLSNAYYEYHKQQKIENFHGLRDYYSLVKYVSRKMLENSKHDVLQVIHRGLLRNFGGVPNEFNVIVKTFFEGKLQSPSIKLCPKVEELIDENIVDSFARHLMLITNGDAVTGAIGNILKKLGRPYRIFYGSNFEEDQKEEYSYRMLSNIIYCMENGVVLILKDLDEIYGSLYDMLNQNYTEVGKKKNCRIALGAHSNPMCHVHEEFRCIVLVDERKLDLSDPPFLNRFEKQRFHFDDLLNDNEKKVCNDLQLWIDDFLPRKDSPSIGFKLKDTFLGYHKNSLPSLLKSLKEENPNIKDEELVQECKHRLLETCTPDAILRLPHSNLFSKSTKEIEDIHRSYIGKPLNGGLNQALSYIIYNSRNSNEKETCRKFVCFTRSSIHTDLRKLLDEHLCVQTESLNTYKSERQMASRFTAFFQDDKAALLIVQCHMANDAEHLLLTKLQIENQQNQYVANNTGLTLSKHVCFLVHMEGREETLMSKYQWQFDYCDNWELYTVDVLDYGEVLPESAKMYPEDVMQSTINKSIYELLNSKFYPVSDFIKQNVLWAFNCLQYNLQSPDPETMNVLVENIKENREIINSLSDLILHHMLPTEQESSILDKNHWQVQVAINPQRVTEGRSLLEAWIKYLEDCVKTPLVKLVWLLENNGSWDCRVNAQDNSWKSELWHEQLKKVVASGTITNQIPKGVHSMIVDNRSCNLSLPLSRLFIEKLREVSTMILKDVSASQYDIDSVNDLDNDDFKKMIVRYSDLVEHRFKDNFSESNFQDEALACLLEDLCNEYSWSGSTDESLDSQIRIVVCRAFCDQRISRLGDISPISKISAHIIIFSLENSRIWSILKLLNMCESCIVAEITHMLTSKMTLKEASDELYSSIEDEAVQVNGIEDMVVEMATESMLPYHSHLSKFKDVNKWFEQTCSSLLLCSRIGSQCQNIHFLRFCFDVIHFVSAQNNSDENILQEFTKLASTEDGTLQLDSERVLNYVLDYDKSNTDVDAQQRKLKLVYLYYIRCIEYNPDTTLMGLMLEKLCGSDLPSDQLDYMGPFLCGLLIDLEQTVADVEYVMELDRTIKESAQLSTLHDVLSGISHRNRLYVMCSDLVTTMVLRKSNLLNMGIEDLNEQMSVFSHVMNALYEDHTKGLKWIVYVAICKTYIQSVARLINTQENLEWVSIFQEIDSYLKETGEEEGKLTTNFQDFFLNSILDGCLMDLKNRCKVIEEAFPSIKEICWPEDGVSLGVGYNVLSLEQEFQTVTDALSLLPDDKNQVEKMFGAICNKDVVQGAIAAVSDKYYWPKYSLGQLKDTDRDFGIWLSTKNKLRPIEKKLLLSLSGRTDFRYERMNISTQHSFEAAMQASVMLHLLCILVPEIEYDKSEKPCIQKSLFVSCVANPDEAESYFIPYEYEHLQQRVLIPLKKYKCKCNSHLITKENLYRCPLCEFDRITQSTLPDLNIKKAKMPKKAKEIPLMNTNDATITENFIHLLVECALLGGYSLGIESVFAEPKAQKSIQKNFTERWSVLKKTLYLENKRFAILLHKLIHNIKAKLICKETNFSGFNDIKVFSEAITNDIHEVLSCRESELVSFHKDILTKGGNNKLCYALNGIDESLDNRQHRIPTINHMQTMMKLVTWSDKTTYKFLQLLQKWEPQLNLLKHLVPILKWQIDLHKAVNHRYTRQEADKTELYTLLHDDRNPGIEELEKSFDKFTNALKCFTSDENQHLVGDLKIPDVDHASSLRWFVIEGHDHFLVAVIEYLLNIQNSFLDEVSRLSLEKIPALRFMLKDSVAIIPSEFVTEMKLKDVVSLEWSPNLLIFAQNEAGVGCGNGILYNFELIEKELANKMIFGKPYLKFQKTAFCIIYKNEMFHWCSQIFKAIGAVVKQESVTKDMQTFIKQGQSERLESMRSTFDFLELVIAMLYKTGGNPRETINTYASRWNISNKLIKSSTIQNQLDKYLYLCHIVSLYEFIENCLSEYVVESIPQDYRQNLTSVVDNDLRKFKDAAYVKLEDFQIALLRTMSRYLKNCDQTQAMVTPHSPLLEIISQESMWPRGMQEGDYFVKEDGSVFQLASVFPKSLRVAHTYTIYKEITKTLKEKQRENEVQSDLKVFSSRPKKKRSSLLNS